MKNFWPELIDIQKKVIEVGLNCLKVNSPLLMIINHHNLLRSKAKTLNEVFESDLELAKITHRQKEFSEGVHNLLILKAKVPPKWTYASLEEVPESLVQTMLSFKTDTLKLDLDYL